MRIKKFIRNPNGLTLLELLAVVVILGIVSAIAIPTFINIIENTKKDTHIANAKQIADAAENYYTYYHLFKENSLGENKIKLITLISEGYLDSIKDPSIFSENYDENSTSVIIKNSGNDTQYFVVLVGSDNSQYIREPVKEVYSLTREDIKIP